MMSFITIFIFLIPVQVAISSLNEPFEKKIQPQNYTGTYSVNTGDISLTLSLNQDEFNMITGTLTSSNGNQFVLEGMASEGVAAGVCSGSDGYLYFEAYLEGNDLTFSLIEPDQFDMPDYETSKYFVFNRGTKKPQQPPQQLQKQPQPSPGEQMVSASQNRPSMQPPAESEVVKDELNGFSFVRPEGWVHQQGDGQILLGSHTIPGVISVFPHHAQNLQEMQGLMNQGIQEEGIYLVLQNGPQQKNARMMSGTYTGIVQGEQAKGHGIGLMSPHGGGVFVLAVSTPEKLGKELIAAAEYIAGNTSFQKQEVGDRELISHFAGEWAWTNGYRTEWMSFFPDGTYSDQAEAGYSGDFTDGSGNITGNWGATGQTSSRGRWNIKGNKDSGVITVIDPDGNQERYEYRVFVEDGEKYYREYLLNGYHYMKQKDF